MVAWVGFVRTLAVIAGSLVVPSFSVRVGFRERWRCPAVLAMLLGVGHTWSRRAARAGAAWYALHAFFPSLVQHRRGGALMRAGAFATLTAPRLQALVASAIV